MNLELLPSFIEFQSNIDVTHFQSTRSLLGTQKVANLALILSTCNMNLVDLTHFQLSGTLSSAQNLINLDLQTISCRFHLGPSLGHLEAFQALGTIVTRNTFSRCLFLPTSYTKGQFTYILHLLYGLFDLLDLRVLSLT